MNTIELIPIALPASPAQSTTAIVQKIEELVAFFDPKIDLVILERQISPTLAAYTSLVAHASHFHWTEQVQADGKGLAALARVLPSGVGQDELVQDLRLLVDLLAEITGADRIGVRLARVIEPLCPRFHVDPVFVRLLSTYTGPGAEWIDDMDVDRRWLGHAAMGKRDEESGLLRAGAKVLQMKPGEVGLFKGKGYPGNENRGAVHRSPPKTHADVPRLLLTLDPLD